MIVVSLRAVERPSPDAEMLALHAPEGLDLPETGVRDPFVLSPRPGGALGARESSPGGELSP